MDKIAGLPIDVVIENFGKKINIYDIKPVVIFDYPISFQENVFMDIPPEKDDKTYRYVLQFHFRGSSVHGDLRLERVEDLIGWTLLIQLEEKLNQPITTLEQAKEFLKNNKDKAFKIDFKTGKVKLRKDKANRLRPLEVQVVPKAAEPMAWLFNQFVLENQLDYLVEGVTPIGTPGSTANYPGVFLIVDKGYVEYGATKPYFYEYFLNTGILSGRWIIRVLSREEMKENKDIIPVSVPEETEIRSAHFWVLIQPKTNLPYVLSKRAVDKNYIPDYKFSALPKVIRDNIPKKFRYWEFKNKDKRIEIRNKLVENYEELNIDLGLIEKFSETKPNFGIWRIWWKRETKEGRPVIVIRWGASTQYYLVQIGNRIFESLYNPFETETFLYERDISENLFKYKEKTKLQTLSKLNPTKATASYIEPIEIGKANVLVNEKDFVKFQYLKKLYTIKKYEDEDFWLLQESDVPKT